MYEKSACVNIIIETCENNWYTNKNLKQQAREHILTAFWKETNFAIIFNGIN